MIYQAIRVKPRSWVMPGGIYRSIPLAMRCIISKPDKFTPSPQFCGRVKLKISPRR